MPLAFAAGRTLLDFLDDRHLNLLRQLLVRSVLGDECGTKQGESYSTRAEAAHAYERVPA